MNQNPPSAAARRLTAIKVATLLLIAVCLGCGQADFRWVSLIGMDHGWLMVAGGVFFLFSVCYLGLLLVLAFGCYRSRPGAGDAELPDCTVIIPAYNEGRAVLKALNSVLASDYPADKLHIIAIDDGSVDDTWQWISAAAEAAPPGRVTAVRLEKNGGKRRALHHGVLHSRSEVVVTVDSDSEVEPAALRRLVTPLADPAVGGVAGNIRVGNPGDGALPRLLEVSFAFNFEIVRATQSLMRTVFCTPGALSAYRREALLPFLGEWVNQTFLGRPAGIGEDRALSTRLLRAGFRVVYQRNAVARTRVPATFGGLCRMYMRWCRGDVRETFSMYRFAFFRVGWFALAVQFNVIMQTMLLLAPVFLLPFLAAGAVLAPLSFLSSMAWTTIIWGTIPALVYLAVHRRGRDMIWGYTFSVFNFFFLFWMIPYCFLTVGDSSWGSRALRRRGRPVESVGDVLVEGRSPEADSGCRRSA